MNVLVDYLHKPNISVLKNEQNFLSFFFFFFKLKVFTKWCFSSSWFLEHWRKLFIFFYVKIGSILSRLLKTHPHLLVV